MSAKNASLPDFIAAGPTRTATTWLYKVLSGRIGLPGGIKETQFFIWNYDLGLDWYRWHFRNCPADLPLMEIAPTYFDSPEARQRVKLHIPDCRIICTLRDPVERAWSHYKFWQQRGLIKAPFATAAFTHSQIVSAGRYAEHIRAWQNDFGAANVMILLYDDLLADTHSYLDTLTAFLGIQPIDLNQSPLAKERVNRAERMPLSHRSARRARKLSDWLSRHRFYRLVRAGQPIFQAFFNGGAPYPPLDPSLERQLRGHLAPEVAKLEQLIERDLSHWKPAEPVRRSIMAKAAGGNDQSAGRPADPLVSVIIPVHNGAATIARAITSALAQDFASFEVIVVNDGSTDDTADVLGQFGDRIRVLTIANRGGGGARNAALGSARGRYLAFLDADDTWEPHKLSATVAPLENNSAVVLTYSDLTAVSPADGSIGAPIISASTGHAPSMDELLTRWWPIIPSTVVVRRDAFSACGGFDEEFRGASYEDSFLWLLVREQGAFAYVPERLVHYRTEGAAARMGKYLYQQGLFIFKVNQRYGVQAKELVRGTEDAYAAALGYEGLMALRIGDYLSARNYFKRALYHRPTDVKMALRLIRTWLPATLARRLSGRTAIP
jgi:glycosyltransferase involved in cell wall biosynthesis